MLRREFLSLFGTWIMHPDSIKPATAQHPSRQVKASGRSSTGQVAQLSSAKLELAGNWRGVPTRAIKTVVERARQACLADVRLVSDRQPGRLRVEARHTGTPAVWLHAQDDMAWVVVNVGERDWSKLAYQFGHELGHVLANSWQPDAKPGPPCQWVEEALVEAFSLRGLGRLAAGWKAAPPFKGDNAFGDSIARYRQDIVGQCMARAEDLGVLNDASPWFADHRSEIEAGDLVPDGQAMAGLFLKQYEAFPQSVEALGALNRWPQRTRVELPAYVAAWEASCLELGASPSLPRYVRTLFRFAPRQQ